MASRTASPAPTGTKAKIRRVALFGAIAWAVGFGALSLYWAIGGDWAAGTIGGEVERLGRERDPAFVALLWVTAALKLALAVPPLLLLRRPDHRGARRLTAAVAVLLVLYGTTSLVQHVLMLSGAVAAPDELSSDELRWHVALWDPVWIAGGVLFAVAGWLSLPRRGPSRAPA